MPVRTLLARCTLGLVLALLSPLAAALGPATYTGTAPVNSQSDADRTGALQTALANVVIAQTGDSSVIARPDVAKAVAGAERYVLQYQYKSNAGADDAAKMTLIAPPQHGGSLATRSFIPHVCHDAIGVLAAVTVATACVLDGSVTEGIAVLPAGNVKTVSVEHPSGEFSVELGLDPANPQNVTRAALLRTARLIMRGEVMVPASVWPKAAAGIIRKT